MVALLISSQKQLDYGKYSRKLSGLLKQDLLILDDFLLHTIVDEAEIKIVSDAPSIQMLNPFGIKSSVESICGIPEGKYSLSWESVQFPISAGHPMSFAERRRLFIRLLILSLYSGDISSGIFPL